MTLGSTSGGKTETRGEEAVMAEDSLGMTLLKSHTGAMFGCPQTCGPVGDLYATVCLFLTIQVNMFTRGKRHFLHIKLLNSPFLTLTECFK